MRRKKFNVNKNSLLSLEANNSAYIVKINCECSRDTCRLSELGLTKGTTIKVIKNDSGPLIIDVKGTKLALGRGIANKIKIDKIDE